MLSRFAYMKGKYRDFHSLKASFTSVLCGVGLLSEDAGSGSDKEAQQLIVNIRQQVQQLDKRWNDLGHACPRWQATLDEVLEVRLSPLYFVFPGK